MFVVFGAGKFANHASQLASFSTYDPPAPDAFVHLTGVIEMAGGLLLIVGLAVRVAAVALVGDMAGAIVVSGIHHGELASLTIAPAECSACSRSHGSRLPAMDRRLIDCSSAVGSARHARRRDLGDAFTR